MMINIVHYWC